MRLKYAKLLTCLVCLVNVILLFYFWKWFTPTESNNATTVESKIRGHSTNKHFKKTMTIIFRDFYHFENDLHHSIESILNLIPNIQILVLYEDEPYPPLNFVANYTIMHPNVKFFNLNFDIRKSAKALSPLLQVHTKYLLLVPDSFRFGGRSIIQKMLSEIEKDVNKKVEVKKSGLKVGPSEQNAKLQGDNSAGDGLAANDKIKSDKSPNKKIVVIPFASNVKTMSNCCRIDVDIANWTMEYSVKNDTRHCDMFLQKHAILLDTNLFKTMPTPLSAPFPEMFYVQAKMSKAKLHFLETGSLLDGKRLFTAFHNKQRRKELRKQEFKEFYKLLQIKKVVRRFAGKPKVKRHNKQNERKSQMFSNTIVLSNATLPLLTNVEYFGCEKNTRSCIGTVKNRKPFYVYLDRNTPPCCLEKLKSVFYHVLEELENVGIRYWLDNFALKSAIDTGQLARDAYEIDISFNSFDLDRSIYLKKCQIRPITDNAGFYWIKATDGHYFRVQFSKQNQIGINLLPFSMVKDRVRANGFFGWKAKEFSSEFLHPMSTVLLLGRNVASPNNVRDFTELKN